MPFKIAQLKAIFSGLPGWLLSSDKVGIARLQADVGSTGFFDGREFRAFIVIDIPAGETRLARVTIAGFGAILRKEQLSIDTGHIDYVPYRDAVLSGPASWSLIGAVANCGFLKKNNLPDAPAWTQKTTVEIGVGNASVTSGTAADFTGLVAASSTAQQHTEGFTDSDERGIGNGVYVFSYHNSGNGTARVIHKFTLEERLQES